MKPLDAPKLERRRAVDFERELLTRARTWIPSWSLDESDADFGLALLRIAARFNSEVAERLDKAGEKMALGFLDWLGLPASAARPARLPVVLKMAETAREPVLAPRPVKMQVDAAGSTVTFETETDLQVISGQLAAVVAVDPVADKYYLPPPGLTSLDPIEPLPTAWKLKNFAAPGAKTLQLDPGIGLIEGMLVDTAGEQYRIAKAKDDLVTIDPEVPAGDGFAGETRVVKVETFRPFDGARNLQEHILYIGDPELLNIEAEARIEIRGLGAVPEGIEWEYWGKSDPEDPIDADPRWRELRVGENPPPTADALVLEKPKGSVESTAAEGVEGRWIRGRLVTSHGMIQSDDVTLRINPLLPGKSAPDAIDKSDWAALLRPEVFVNSTSSPPDSFYPLGREPRMFDTLYVGSSEAFSKTEATAWVKFELGDSTFAALSALLESPAADRVVAGIGKDGALRLFAFDPQTGTLTLLRGLEPLQPTAPGGSGAPARLGSVSNWPLPIWIDPASVAQFHVAAWAEGDVWLWDETGIESGTWRQWGTVPSAAQQPSEIKGLIYLPAGMAQGASLIALRDGRLHKTPVTGAPQWDEIDTKESGNPVDFATLAPIFAATAASFIGSADLGLVGISIDKNLYLIDVGTGICTPIIGGVDPATRPAAGFDMNGDFAAVAARDGPMPGLLAYNDATSTLTTFGLLNPAIRAISVGYAADALHFMATINTGGPTVLLDVPRPEGGDFNDRSVTNLPAGFGSANGAPLILDANILIPGAEADIFIAEFDLANRITQAASIKPGLLVPGSGSPTLLPSDTVVMFDAASAAIKCVITGNATTSSGEALYPLDNSLPAGGTLPVFAYQSSGTAPQGTIDSNTQFTLANGDNQTARNMWLLIDGVPKRVKQIDPNNPRKIEIEPAFATAGPATVDYLRPITTAGRPVSYLELNPAANGAWDADLLEQAPITFGNPPTDTVWARAFTRNGANRPLFVLLDDAIATSAAQVPFLIDAAAGQWQQALGDTATNPELAWEYFDGTSWLRLTGAVDSTNHLRKSGTLSFIVPEDLRPGEWAGKTSHWIRARLIGGDYGKENVSVVSKPGPGAGETTQTVERTTEGIQPPYALHVGVAYAVTAATVPTYLQTQDSGSLRNQSDANRTPGAQVEIFTPLAITLGRLDAPAAPGGSAENCVPDCECDTGSPSMSPAPSPAALQTGSTPANASGAGRRALYLGFTSKLLGQPVNVLFTVDRESDYDAIGPIGVDALVGDRFAPIVSTDDTRALGETGLLKMTFEVAPLEQELFGRALSWLRLAPRIGSDDWKPSIAGAYPNGVWTRAAETMTRELLGSSDGRPSLTVTLARPPLLQGSLELRVREPLGEEERTALTKEDPNLVKSNVTDLPGHWILWKQVSDPADCGPKDRVYSLDEATGTVRFGDGLHGMIPPIGVDAIVAFSYERTEPAIGEIIAANFVTPRTELNLVTAVENVETVIAADQSAGGAAPESKQRVLQFAAAKLRHRERAVSLRDIEDLVRQKFEDVVQARAFNRNGRVRLVVVTKGANPSPSRAQQRELRRTLLEIAPPAMGVRGALTITGPRVRHLRIALGLRVASLDVGGDIASEAKKRLVTAFDASIAWLLGSTPREDDVAEALIDMDNLGGIVSIVLLELDELGGARPWQGSVATDHLVMLAPEDVRVGFNVMEAAA